MNSVFFLSILCILTSVTRICSVPVRLVGGTGSHEGRLEVYLKGRWGTVADTRFDQYAAQLVCRQLGLPGPAVATTSSVFGKGAGHISLNSIHCLGYRDRSIDDCTFNSEHLSLARHENDVGVVCNASIEFGLVGGSDSHEGRLEARFNDQLGSAYLDQRYSSGLSSHESDLICRHFGFVGSVVTSNRDFGAAEGPTWVGSFYCPQNIPEYWSSTIDPISCVRQWGSWKIQDPNRLAILVCNNTVEGTDIRLVGGSGSHEGRLEVHYQGRWGTVCGGDISDRHKTLDVGDLELIWTKNVCKQLGFGNGQTYETSSIVFGQGIGWVWTYVFFCTGDRNFPCVYVAEGQEMDTGYAGYCDHTNDVGIICNVTSPPPVRLINGPKPNEGLPQIQFTGVWGTVCHAWYNWHEAQAVCRQLGYSGHDTTARNETRLQFGSNPQGMVWLKRFTCLDDAARIDFCLNSHPLGPSSCSLPADDLGGIVCNDTTPPAPIRLVGGRDSSEGRLEIFHSGEWGSVCIGNTHAWGKAEADVVCRQLGYSPDKFHMRKSRATSAAIFGEPTNGTIWLNRVKCNVVPGDENWRVQTFVLKECDHGEWGESGGCDHSKDVGVICRTDFFEQAPLVRLVGGNEPYEGRLEIYFQDKWGTVCQKKGWDSGKLPQVVCGQIGLGDGTASLTRQYGGGDGHIWLEGIQCNGNASGIDSCYSSAWGAVTCDHSMDIGIKCNDDLSINIGAIVGIVVAVVVVVVIVVIIIIYCKRSK